MDVQNRSNAGVTTQERGRNQANFVTVVLFLFGDDSWNYLTIASTILKGAIRMIPRKKKEGDRRKKGELSEEQINEIKEAFVLFDTDGSGPLPFLVKKCAHVRIS